MGGVAPEGSEDAPKAKVPTKGRAAPGRMEDPNWSLGRRPWKGRSPREKRCTDGISGVPDGAGTAAERPGQERPAAGSATGSGRARHGAGRERLG